jgi:hypothetical protein
MAGSAGVEPFRLSDNDDEDEMVLLADGDGRWSGRPGWCEGYGEGDIVGWWCVDMLVMERVDPAGGCWVDVVVGAH